MRFHRPSPGFSAGLLIGLLAGSASVAVGSLSYKGWQRFPYEFRDGYLHGFLDMANLARNLQPGGYVDQRFPYVPKASALEWYAAVDNAYKDPANQELLVSSVMMIASRQLRDKYGPAQDPHERVRQKLEQQLKAVAAKKAAEAAKDAASGAAPAATNADAAKADAANAAAAAPAPKQVAKTAPPPRKWCRCDGVDPKKARAERRAAAAAEEKAAGEKPAGATAPVAAPAAR